MSLLNQLKRRSVLKVGAAYVVTSWLLIQVAETIFPLYGFGDAPARMVVTILAIGFIPTLIFSWVFEFTAEGLIRESEVGPAKPATPKSSKKLDRMIMVMLALALGYFTFDKFVLDPQRDVAVGEAAAEAAIEQLREEALLGMMNDKSVAVLPFDNRSNLDEDLFFTDGMHDELLTRLSRISELNVISRTSVMQFRGSMMSIPDIAKELSVATILEGGVQRAGNQVRINVQLIDARTDEHLWAEIYDRELTTENLFAIQSEISASIAGSLHAALSPEERERVFEMPTENLEAYNHFLRGRQLMATRKKEGMLQGLDEFTRATELDPNFALAWVGLADSINLLDFYGDFPERDQQLDMRQEAVDKALAINDQLGEAYASLANIYRNKFEHDKAEAAYIKAIELNPNYAQAFLWYSFTKLDRDEKDERLQLIYRAAELDPLSSNIQSNLAGTLMWGAASANAEHNQEGRQVMMKLLDRDPDFASGYRMLGNYQADWGQLANAVRNHRKALELDPGNVLTLSVLANLYVSLGDFEAFEATRRQLEENSSPYHSEHLMIKFSLLRSQKRWDEAWNSWKTIPVSRP